MQLIETRSGSVFRSATDSMRDYIVRFDSEMRHLYLNDEALELYGVKIDKIIGKSLIETDLFDKSMCSKWENAIKSVLTQGIPWKGQMEWKGKGNTITLDFNLIPEYDKSGNLISVLGLFHNIYTGLDSEKELRINELRYKAILAASPDGITITDLQGEILMVSPSVIEMYGSEDLDFFVGKNISEFLHSDDRERAFDKISKMFQGVFDGPEEYRIMRCDGTTYNAEINAGFITNKTGKPDGVVFISRENSGRKEIEEALRDSEEIFTQFLENSPIYIFFKDREIRSLRLSRNFEKMLGKPLNELLGKTMAELFPSDFAKEMLEDDLRILREGKQIEKEEEFNNRQYITTKFPIFKNGQPFYLAGYTIDITENKKASRYLKQKANELKRFNNLMLGREMRMMELKREVNDLLRATGKGEKYNIH